jgi:hypothetical protein
MSLELILDTVIAVLTVAALVWMERCRRAEVRRDDAWDGEHGIR